MNWSKERGDDAFFLLSIAIRHCYTAERERERERERKELPVNVREMQLAVGRSTKPMNPTL